MCEAFWLSWRSNYGGHGIDPTIAALLLMLCHCAIAISSYTVVQREVHVYFEFLRLHFLFIDSLRGKIIIQKKKNLLKQHKITEK